MFSKNGPSFFELMHQALVSTREGYELLAPKFDATPFRTPDEVLEPSMAAIGPVDTALDVCCGTGAAMRYLAPLCRERLAGIDFSPAMLNEARRKLAGVNTTAAISFIDGDVLAMDFNAEFDLAVCFGALGHILDRDQRTFLRRIHKALKPGGRFAFATGPHPPVLSRTNIVYRTFNGIMRVRNALIRPPFIMYYLTFLLPEIVGVLEDEGFVVQVVEGLFPRPFQRGCLVIAKKSAHC